MSLFSSRGETILKQMLSKQCLSEREPRDTLGPFRCPDLVRSPLLNVPRQPPWPPRGRPPQPDTASHPAAACQSGRPSEYAGAGDEACTRDKFSNSSGRSLNRSLQKGSCHARAACLQWDLVLVAQAPLAVLTHHVSLCPCRKSQRPLPPAVPAAPSTEKV